MAANTAWDNRCTLTETATPGSTVVTPDMVVVFTSTTLPMPFIVGSGSTMHDMGMATCATQMVRTTWVTGTKTANMVLGSMCMWMVVHILGTERITCKMGMVGTFTRMAARTPEPFTITSLSPVNDTLPIQRPSTWALLMSTVNPLEQVCLCTTVDQITAPSFRKKVSTFMGNDTQVPSYTHYRPT